MPHPDMSAHWEGGHPDEGLLHEWLDEQLSAEAASHIALHVAACAECAAVVAEARGLIAASHRILSALDEVPANVVPSKVASKNAAVSNVASADVSVSRAPQSRTGAAKHPSSIHWSRLGKIAAVLVVAVAAPLLLRDRPSTAPLQSASQPPTAATERAIGFAAADSGATAEPMLTSTQPPAVARGAVANTAPVAAAKSAPVATAEKAPVAAADIAASDVASAGSRADTSAPLRALEMQKAVATAPTSALAARSAGAGAGAEVRASAQRSLVAAAPPAPAPPAAASQASPAPRAVGSNLAFADASEAVSFDSVNIARNVCDPACSVTELHINAQGVVRYIIGSGSEQRTVRAQLSTANRLRLGALLLRQFPAADDRRGFVSCAATVESAPALQMELAFGLTAVPATASRCAASPAELRALADAIEAMVNTSALRRGGV